MTTTLSGKVLALRRTVERYTHLDDSDLLLFVLGVAASVPLDRPPLWGLIVGAPSGGKSEVIRLLDDVAEEQVDELTAPALLAAKSRKLKSGNEIAVEIGLLPSLRRKTEGGPGMLTVSDFSNILQGVHRDRRAQLFAALRRVYDGRYRRDLGQVEKPLEWSGKLTLLAACTPAIDNFSAHEDALGPRFVYLRLPERDTDARRAMARHVRGRSVTEDRARAQRQTAEIVAEARQEVLDAKVGDDLADELVEVAIGACVGRGSVERDYKGEPTGLPVIEEPPRFASQLHTLALALGALGMPDEAALGLCRRVGRDSMPRTRARVLGELVSEHEPLSAAEVARRIGADRKTARRALTELEALRIVTSGKSGRVVGGGSEEVVFRLDGDEAYLVRPLFRAESAGQLWD